jgi:hypothetical protein
MSNMPVINLISIASEWLYNSCGTFDPNTILQLNAMSNIWNGEVKLCIV